MHFDELLTRDFRTAIREYTYFLERRFPTKPLLKLLGDRYRLNAWQRTILFRGVVERTVGARRRSTLVDSCRNQELFVDAYNVLYTVANYLLGRVLFIAGDGFLRDVGELHSRGVDEEVFVRARGLVITYLQRARPSKVEMIFDSPISRSGETAAAMRRAMEGSGIRGSARTEPSADSALKEVHGLIATSDSAIIDSLVRRRTRNRTFDLARKTLEYNCSTRFRRLMPLQRGSAIQFLFRLER